MASTSDPDEASELGLLASAPRALVREPLAALALLRRHAAAYPESRYAQERAALGCDAYARLGQEAELRAAVAAFLRAFPGSPHRARLAKLLHAAPPSGAATTP